MSLFLNYNTNLTQQTNNLTKINCVVDDKVTIKYMQLLSCTDKLPTTLNVYGIIVIADNN